MSIVDVITKGKDLLGDIAEGAIENVSDLALDAKEFAVDKYQDVKTGFEKSGIEGGIKGFVGLGETKKVKQLSDEDKQYIQRIKKNTGMQDVGELLGLATDWLGDKKYVPEPIDFMKKNSNAFNWGWNRLKEFVGMEDQYDFELKSGINKDNFGKEYDEKRGSYELSVKKLGEFQNTLQSSGKYNTYFSFQNEVDKYISEGKSQDEAIILAQNNYDDKSLKNINKEFESLQKDSSETLVKYYQEIADNEGKLKDFIESNVDLKEGEDALSVLQKPKYKGTIGITQDISMKSSEEVDFLLSFENNNTINETTGLDKKIQKTKELFTDLELRRLQAISETPEEEQAEINQKYIEQNEVMKKFYINQIKDELKQRTSKPADFDKNEDAAEKKSALNAFYSLSEDEREIFKNRKIFDGLMSTKIEASQLKDSIKDGKVLGTVLDTAQLFMGSLGLGINYTVDKSVENLPKIFGNNYMGDAYQATRYGNAIVNADNGVLKKTGDWLKYNAGDIVNTIASIAIGGKVFQGVSGATSKTSQFVKDLTANTKVAQAVEFLVGGQKVRAILNPSMALGSKIAESVITGVLPNKAIDDALGQIGTRSNEDFNLITDLFFDTTILPVAGGGLKKTKNALTFDIMFGESKKIRDGAIKDFTEYMKGQGIKIYGQDVTEKNVYKFVRDSIMPLYKQTLNPYVYDKIFNKGEIVDFLTKYIKQSEENGVNKILTSDTLGFKVTDPFKELTDKFNDIGYVAKTSLIDSAEGKINKGMLEKYLNAFERQVKGEGFINDLNLVRLNPVPKTEIDEFVNVIRDIKASKTISQMKTNIEKLKTNIENINVKYAKEKYEIGYTIIDSITGNEFKITKKNFDKLQQSTGLSMQDYIERGWIEITEKAKKETGLDIQKGKYTFSGGENGLYYVSSNTRKIYNNLLEFYQKSGLNENMVGGHTQDINTLITGLGFGGGKQEGVRKMLLSKFTVNGLLGEGEQLDFIFNELKKVYGDKIGKLDLGRLEKSPTDIIKLSKEKDTYLNFTHGVLKGKDDGEEYVILYITPGGKLYNTSIGEELLGLEDGLMQSGGFSILAEKFSNILKDILKFSKVEDGILNVGKGIEILDSINFYKKVNFFTDGKLDKAKINGVVGQSLKLFSEINNKYLPSEVKDSIYKAVNSFAVNFEKSSDDLLGVIIKNITYKLASNFDNIKLLDKLKKISDVDKKIKFFKEFFLSGSIRKQLSKNKKLIEDFSIEDSYIIKALESDYNKFLTGVKKNLDSIDENLLILEKSKKDLRISKQNVDDINIDIEKYNKLKKEYTKKYKISLDDYIKNNLDSLRSGSILNALEKTTGNMSNIFDDVINKIDLEIISKKDLISENKKLTKDLSGFNDIDRKQIINFIDDLSKKINKNDRKIFITDFLTNENINKEVKDFINNNNLVSKFDYDYVDEKKIIELIEKQGKDIKGIFDIDVLVKRDGPIDRDFTELFSGKANKENNETKLFKSLKKIFSDDNSNNLFELYNNNENFKNFIDNLKVKKATTSLFDSSKINTEYLKRKKDFNNIIEKLIKENYLEIQGLSKGEMKDVIDDVIKSLQDNSSLYKKFKKISDIKKRNFIRLEIGEDELFDDGFKRILKSGNSKIEYTPERILSKDDIDGDLVFGSNTEGRHGKGVAKIANSSFGAIYGQAKGHQGNSYAIITKDLSKGERSVSLEDIKLGIIDALKYYKDKETKAYFTKIGSGLGGYSEKEMVELFQGLYKKNPEYFGNNIILPKEYSVNKVGYFDDNVFKIEEMLEKINGVSFIKLPGNKGATIFSMLKVKNGWSIKNEINKLINNGKIDEKYFSDEEIYKEIINLYEGNKSILEILPKSQQDFLLEDLKNIFELKEREIITGTFGDKFNYIQKWEVPENIPMQIAQEFYGVNYGLSLGYKNSGKIFKETTGKIKYGLDKEKTFNDFVKDFYNDLLNKGNNKPTKEDFFNFLRDGKLGEGYKITKKIDGEEVVIDAVWGDYLLPFDKIAKREASHTSSVRTFDNLETDLDLLILKQDIDGDNIYNKLLKEFKKAETEEDKNIILDEIKRNISVDSDDKLKSLVSNLDNDRMIKFLENTFNKDNKDGWAGVSLDVGKIRDIINKGQTDNHSFKDHVWGVDNNNEMYFIKSLFNKYKISDTKGELKKTVVTTESSYKLGTYEKIDGYKIKINGKEYDVIGKKKINTRDFKDAAAESYIEKDEQSLALQIPNSLPFMYSDHYLRIMKEELDQIYLSEINNNLGEFNISDRYKNDIDKEILNVAQFYKAYGLKVGEYSDTVIGQYIEDFLRISSEFINKGKTNGTNSYIESTSLDVGFNEVKMSSKNKAFINARNDLKNKIKSIKAGLEEGDEELIDLLEKKLKDNDLEIVGYRYPVASEYNIGTYKIKIDDTISDENVIMNPFQVFLKKEGDFDGDGLFMISPYTKRGEIISKSSIDGGGEYLPKKDGSYILENGLIKLEDNLSFYKRLSENDYINKYVLVTQADEIEESVIKKDMNLFESRYIASEAKGSVGIVQSLIRTMRLFTQMQGKLNYLNNLKQTEEVLNLKKELLSQRFNIGDYDYKYKNFPKNSFITFEDVLKKYGNFKEFNINFDEEAAGILQVALDFAKSGRSEFPKNWIDKLLDLSIDNLDNKNLFYKDIGSLLQKQYKLNDTISRFDFRWLPGEEKKGIDDLINRYATNKIGIKGDLYKYIIEKFGKNIKDLNTVTEIKVISDMLTQKDIDKNSIFGALKLITNKKGFRFLSKTDKSELLSMFKKIDNKNVKTYIDEFNKLKNTGLKDYEVLEQMNKESIIKGSREDRLLFATYVGLNGYSKIFDLLTIKEQLDYIKVMGKSKYSSVKLIKSGLEESSLSIKTVEDFDKEIKNIKNLISDAKKESGTTYDEIGKLEKELENLEIEKNNYIKQIEKLEGIKLSQEKELEISGTLDMDVVEKIPNIDWELVLDNKSLQDLSISGDYYLATMRGFGTFHISNYLFKHDKVLLDRINFIQQQVKKYNGIELAIKNKEFGKKFENILKGYGLRKDQLQSYLKNIDGAFTQITSQTEGIYKVTGYDKIIDTLNKLNINSATGFPIVDISSDTLFKDLLKQYKEEVIDKSLDGINDLINISKGSVNKIDISNYFGKGKNTLFKDFIEAMKNDYEFALRTLGINDSKMLKDRLSLTGMTERGINIVTNTLIPGTSGMTEKAIGFLHAIHYMSRYGIIGTKYLLGQIMGMAQLIPNAMQIIGHATSNKQHYIDAQKIIDKYKLLEGEDTLMFGLGYETEMSSNGLFNYISEIVRGGGRQLGKVLKVDDLYKFEKGVEAFVMSPLSYFDFPLDKMRRQGALIDTLRQMGIGLDEFDGYMKQMDNLGYARQDILNNLTTRIRSNYVKSGGGVISGSQLYRKTFLNTFDIYGEKHKNVLPRALMGTIGYLNGWGFHNTSTLLDAQLNIFRAGNNIAKGNFKEASLLLTDWMIYNKGVINNMMMGAGLYLKFEKYERDGDQLPSADEFVKDFTNILVSLQMLGGVIFDKSQTANRFGDKSDILGYTTLGMIERYTRSLMYAPRLITTIYDRAKTYYEAGGEFNKFTAITRAIDDSLREVNDSFVRYNGIQAMKDGYDTYTNNTNIAVLGLGGNDAEDKIFDYVTKGKNFAFYDQKGFIASVLNYFGSWGSPLEYGINYNTTRTAREILKELRTNNAGKILSNKGISSDGEGGSYDIRNLIGFDENITEEQTEIIDKLMDSLRYDITDKLDSKGRNIPNSEFYMNKLDDIVTSRMKTLAEQEGINIEEVLNSGDTRSPGFMKLLALVDYAGEGKAIELVSYIINKRRDEIENEFKDLYSQTNQKGYRVVEDRFKRMADRQALIEYSDLLNTDGQIVNDIFELEFEYNNKDLYNRFKETTRDEKILTEVNRMAANEYIATRNLQRGDTSVGALTSRFSTIFKGLPAGDEDSARIIIDTLQMIENTSQDGKTKVAKQAAAILGIDNATYKLLQDNKRFESLSYNAKKTLVNWFYKISDTAWDYDSNKMLNDLNESGYGKNQYFKTPYIKKNYSNQRPNYSKQFAPIEKLAQRYPQYYNKNHNNIVGQQQQAYRKDTPLFFKTPYMKKINQYKIEAFMNEFYSKGIFKGGNQQLPIAKPIKRTIMEVRKKKVKNKTRYFTPVYNKVREGLLSDKPFNYD